MRPEYFPRPTRILAVCLLFVVGTIPVMAGHTSIAPILAMQQAEPVTFYHAQYYAFGIEVPQYDVFDPAIPAGTHSITSAENLFLGLVDDAPVGGISPEMATGWTVSENGRIWTFTLRDDVPWVRWNPAAGRGRDCTPSNRAGL